MKYQFVYYAVNLSKVDEPNKLVMEIFADTILSATVAMLQQMNTLNAANVGSWQYYTNLALWDEKLPSPITR